MVRNVRGRALFPDEPHYVESYAEGLKDYKDAIVYIVLAKPMMSSLDS